ncbi:MAG: OmpH family outer membrane protein [bacterium]
MENKRILSSLLGLSAGIIFLIGVLLVPTTSWAPPLIKIGVVNWEQVVLQYDEYQNELKELQKKRKRILQFIEKEYGDVQKDKLKGKSKPSSMDQELQSLYEDTLQQHKKRRQRTIENFHQKIKGAIREEAVEQGYSLILSENEVLYAAEGYTDLTSDVIQRLNKSQSQESS